MTAGTTIRTGISAAAGYDCSSSLVMSPRNELRTGLQDLQPEKCVDIVQLGTGLRLLWALIHSI